MSELNKAFKTLQILGQTLKNFPAIEGDTKYQIARACYELGLRALGTVLRLLEENRPGLVEHMAEAIMADQAGFSHEKATEEARETLAGLALMSGLGMVQRIAGAVGSPDLSTTYTRVLKDVPTTAVRLIHTEIRLQQVTGFPEKLIVDIATDLKAQSNPYALTLLKALVMQAFDLFDPGFKTKQSVCTALGLTYKPIIGANPRLRLLPPRS